MITLSPEILTSTGRNYNQEFWKLLIRHPKIGEPPLFGLLLRAEKIVGGEIWLVEKAICEVGNIPEVQVSDEEREHLKKLIADLKGKHTAEVLATVERVARAFNPSADEGKTQTVISNAIKTSNLTKIKPHLEAVNQPKTPEEHIPSLVSQAAPEPATQANIETLKQYLNLGIKIIPVCDNGAFISTGNPRDWRTGDISEIRNLISGNGYRNGLGRGSKIKLFRFFPIDYGLVVIDVDRHKNTDGKLEKDGLKTWCRIEKKLSQNCRLTGHTCYVRTPSNGYHLYFRLKEKADLKTEIAKAIDILHTKTVNIAGSLKEGEEYKLIGSLDTIPNLPDELKELMLKLTRIEPQQIRRDSIPHNFSNGNKYLGKGKLAAYKPFLREYLDAKGFQINTKGLTNCPLTEHHNNGDKHPSAQVNKDFLYCFTARRGYDIWGVAKQLNGGDFRAACADVVKYLKKEKKWIGNRHKKS
jgi:hypothetical protein